MDDFLFVRTPADVERMLGERLRRARKAKGWTQADLATRSGLSIATVARLEQSGQGQISSLVRLCAAFGRLDDFEEVLKAVPPATMDELRRLRAGDP
ncbi:MAG: helix-turn-helix domain-containing protein [Myxococcota bacterium]